MNFINKLLFAALIAVVPMLAQAESVTLILKNGTTIVGDLISLDPTSVVEISVAGVNAKINFSDIEKIQKEDTANTSSAFDSSDDSSDDLPAEKVINIAGIDVKFILVEGGTFSYGYDGRGSLKFKSEPVHDVTLSPFYISEDYVSIELFKSLVEDYEYDQEWSIVTEKKEKLPELDGIAFTFHADGGKDKKPFCSIETLVHNLKTNYPELSISIPTEVQWFYVASLQHPTCKNVRMLDCPEMIQLVSMQSANDPIGEKYYTHSNWRTKKENRLINRNSEDSYPFVYDKSNKRLIRLVGEMDNTRYQVAKGLAPFHLVIPTN